MEAFEHGAALRARILSVEVGVLCPEETAFYIPHVGGILAIGDALIRRGDELGFVPDRFIGEDPEAVKRGLFKAFERLLDWDFEHMLLVHGEPIIGEAKAELQGFVEKAIS